MQQKKQLCNACESMWRCLSKKVAAANLHFGHIGPEMDLKQEVIASIRILLSKCYITTFSNVQFPTLSSPSRT